MPGLASTRPEVKIPPQQEFVWTKGSTPGDWFQLREQVKATGAAITVFVEAEPAQDGRLVACVDEVIFVAMACDCCCEPEGYGDKSDCCCSCSDDDEPRPPTPRPDRRCLDFSQVTPKDGRQPKIEINGFVVATLSGAPLHFVFGGAGGGNGLVLNPGGIEIAFPFPADKATATFLYQGGKAATFDVRNADGTVVAHVEGTTSQQGIQSVTIEAPAMVSVVASGQEVVLLELCIETPKGPSRDVKNPDAKGKRA